MVTEIEEIEETIIDDEVTEETLEGTLEEAPMLEKQEKVITDLKEEVESLKAKIELLLKTHSPPDEDPKEPEKSLDDKPEEKSLEETIDEILTKKLEDIPTRKGVVDTDETEAKFTEKEVSVDNMVEEIDKMSTDERNKMFHKWGLSLIPFSESSEAEIEDLDLED